MATTDKYDRQLRLWGTSGQRALENTLVVLFGTAASGTETLKNLVLPGVGSFLIIDDDNSVVGKCISYETAGSDFATLKAQKSPAVTDSLLTFPSHSSNFFLPKGSVLSNAAKVCALLSELNPDVHGCHHTVPSLDGFDYTSFLKMLLKNPPSFDASTPTNIIVIAADQPSVSFLPLSYACHAHSIPLVVVRSYGLLGWVRIQTASPYHAIIESKPAHRIPDLRLSAWPLFSGLKKVASSVQNLDEMEDTKDHSHVPFVVVLLQALEKWQKSVSALSNGVPEKIPRYPKSFSEKESFRKLVRDMAKNLSNELNFEEAIREAHLVWVDGRLSDDVKLVLEKIDEDSFFDSAIQSDMDVEGESSSLKIPSHVLQFQLLALALKRFLKENDDYPPLEGMIPDMTSDTARYVALQEAYQQQAEKDRSKITEIITSLLEECHQKSDGCDFHAGVTMPPDDDISTFCKNARYLRILETRPLYAEYGVQDPSSPVVLSLIKTLPLHDMPNFDIIQSDARSDLLVVDPYDTDATQTPMLWWIALRACDAFYDRHQHYPGKHDQKLALEADAKEVYRCMVEITNRLGLAECDIIKEHLLHQDKGMDLAREVVRYNEAEIHNVAAVVGGVASQEVVKLISGQYVPLDDTYVYNGIASTAGVYRF